MQIKPGNRPQSGVLRIREAGVETIPSIRQPITPWATAPLRSVHPAPHSFPEHIQLHGRINTNIHIGMRPDAPLQAAAVRRSHDRIVPPYTPEQVERGQIPVVVSEPEHFSGFQRKHTPTDHVRQQSVREPESGEITHQGADRDFFVLADAQDLLPRPAVVSFVSRKFRSEIGKYAVRCQYAICFFKGMPHALPVHSSQRP